MNFTFPKLTFVFALCLIAISSFSADKKPKKEHSFALTNYQALNYSDTIYIGVGNQYSSLSKSGGLFEALGSGALILTKELTVVITSDLSEDGSFSLGNTGLNGHKISFTPSSATVKNITNAGNILKSLIHVSAANQVVIDGSFNGSGRFLRFSNTHTTAFACRPTFLINNSTNSVWLRNLIIESNYYNQFNEDTAAVVIGNGNNTNIEISGCQITSPQNSAFGPPSNAVISNSVGNKIVLQNNEVSNFASHGIYLRHVASGSKIENNHFFYNFPSPAGYSQHAIRISSGTSHRLEGNYIGGSAPFCGGTAWLNDGNELQPNTGAGENIYGIFLSVGVSDSTVVRGNTIQNIRLTKSGTTESVVFNGIRIDQGWVNVIANTIGHPSSSHSITNAGNGFGSYTRPIHIGSASQCEIKDNIVANITASGFTSNVSLCGIFNATAGPTKVTNNKIYELNSGSSVGGLNSESAVRGIYLTSYTSESLVEGNVIHGLKAGNANATTRTIGIELSTSTAIVVQRNKIYNLQNLSPGGGEIIGIRSVSSASSYINNQLSLSNHPNTNDIAIIGIRDDGTASKKILYNTIFIDGVIATGVSPSDCYRLIQDNKIASFRNNILYNRRSGGTGNHLAVANRSWNNTPTPRWTIGSSNNNLYVTNDTAKVNEWPTSYPNNLIVTMRDWKSLSKGDSISYSTTASILPAERLFADITNGDLNINTADSLCWYVNGKGMPLAGISGDLSSAAPVRSTNSTTGSTDIGSDEFNTTTGPPVLFVYGRHQRGGADTLSLNGRTLAVITWGNTGTLPDLGEVRFYSGAWPNDLTNDGSVQNARTMCGYLQIPTTGGSNFSYSLTLFYDSSMLGKILSESTMVINKREIGVPGSWRTVRPTAVNTTLKTLTISNQTSFSEFTATDAFAPLPVALTDFVASVLNKNVRLSWQVASERNLSHYDVERSIDDQRFITVGRVFGKYRNEGGNYTFDDLGTSEKQGPFYYRLKQVDNSGVFVYSQTLVVSRSQSGNYGLVSIYPTSFSSVKFVYHSSQSQRLQVRVYDLSGRLVHSKIFNVSAGRQSIELTDLYQLKRGRYLLHLGSTDDEESCWINKE